MSFGKDSKTPKSDFTCSMFKIKRYGGRWAVGRTYFATYLFASFLDTLSMYDILKVVASMHKVEVASPA